jgi:hypothetical protein
MNPIAYYQAIKPSCFKKHTKCIFLWEEEVDENDEKQFAIYRKKSYINLEISHDQF